MRNLKYDPNELIYKRNRLTDTKSRLVVAKGATRGMDRESGISRCQAER